GYRIVRGGGTYVRPFREKVQHLSLELMQFDVRTGETYSSHGVPVQVDGVCMVKVDPSDEGIQLAAEEFLSRGRDDIARTAQQEVRAQELQVEIVERQKAIELMEAEVARRINELEAEVIEPAKSEARKIEALAEARKEEIAAQGAGEADAARLRGMAEAEAMLAKATAWGKYSDAAIADRLLSILPQLAAAVSEPLSKTEKIVMIGGNGDGDGVGAHRITRDVMKIVAELPEVLESLTGKRLDELVKALPKAGANGEDS